MLNELNSEWLNDILLNMEDAVCLTGKNGELLYANPAALNLFSLDVTLSPKIWDAIPYVEGNDALIQLFIDGVTQKRESFSAPVDYVNNEGELFRLYVTLTCKPSKSGTILIVIHNLTKLIKVYSAFERYTSPEIADYVLSTPEGEKQGGQVQKQGPCPFCRPSRKPYQLISQPAHQTKEQHDHSLVGLTEHIPYHPRMRPNRPRFRVGCSYSTDRTRPSMMA